MVNKILGSVILYNPDPSTLDNIATYIQQVDELIIVDNSDNSDPEVIKALINLPKSTYVSNDGNVGIAKALNVAAAFGIEKNYSWLLTMDQDSLFESNNISILINDLDKLTTEVPNLGILTPYHLTQTIQPIEQSAKTVFKVRTCMTSGNIINLGVWQDTGGFAEKLFIDYVDHEYCLRIRKEGSVVYQTNNATLKHFLGNSQSFKFLGKRTASHHNYLRRYYLTRNRLYMITRYFLYDPVTCSYECYNLLAEAFKMLLQENNKRQKLKSIFRGVRDFIIGRYGKYSYK